MSDDPFAAIPNPEPVKIRKKKKKVVKKKKKKKTEKTEKTDGDSSSSHSHPTTSTFSNQSKPAVSSQQHASQTTAANALIFACAIQLYEHNGLEQHLMGVKGAAIVGSSKENKFHILIYESDSKHQVLVVTLNYMFRYDLQAPPNDRPNTWMASFMDDLGNYWSVQFSSSKDADNFARHIALVKSFSAMARSGPRNAGIVKQDLNVGQLSASSVQTGDHVKVKYALFELSPTHPKGLGRRIATVGLDNPKVYHLGSGKLGKGIEQGVMGMKKDGRRIIVLPPQQPTDAQHWKSDPDHPVIVEIAIIDVKLADRSSTVNLFDQTSQQALPQEPIPTQRSIHPSTGGQSTQDQQNLQKNVTAQASRRAAAQQYGSDDAIHSQLDHNPHYTAQTQRMAMQQAHEHAVAGGGGGGSDASAGGGSDHEAGDGGVKEWAEEDSLVHTTEGGEEEEHEKKVPVSMRKRVQRLAKAGGGGMQPDWAFLFGGGKKGSAEESGSKEASSHTENESDPQPTSSKETRRHSLKEGRRHSLKKHEAQGDDSTTNGGVEHKPDVFRQGSSAISTSPIKHPGLKPASRRRQGSRASDIEEINEKSEPVTSGTGSSSHQKARKQSYEDIREIFEKRRIASEPKKSSNSSGEASPDDDDDLPDLETRPEPQHKATASPATSTLRKKFEASSRGGRGRGRGRRGRGRGRGRGGHHTSHSNQPSTPETSGHKNVSPQVSPKTSSKTSTTTTKTSSRHVRTPSTSDEVDTMEQILTRIGLHEYVTAFKQEHISLQDALLLSLANLKMLVPRLGPRTRLQNELEDIKQRQLGLFVPSSTSGGSGTVTSPRNGIDDTTLEYLRGKEDGRIEATRTQEEIQSSRTQITNLQNQIKRQRNDHEQSQKHFMQNAKSKISELQREIDDLTRQRDAALSETEVVRQRGREYVGNLKNEVATKLYETSVRSTRDAMTELYGNVKKRIQKQMQENEVYDSNVTYSGEEILSLTKEAIKEATQIRMQELKDDMKRRSS